MKNNTFDYFVKLAESTSLIGLNLSNGTDYFCVPLGAKIFAELEVDGIQFCFIDGFREMVFVISPEAVNEKFVNPVSNNFEDFIALILACKNANPIEQIYWQSKEQFMSFLKEDIRNTTPEQEKVLTKIQSELNVLPIETPYDYVRNIQTNFEYSQFKFTDEYYDVLGLPH